MGITAHIGSPRFRADSTRNRRHTIFSYWRPRSLPKFLGFTAAMSRGYSTPRKNRVATSINGGHTECSLTLLIGGERLSAGRHREAMKSMGEA